MVRTSEFVEMVKRNSYRNDLRFMVSRWGRYQGAPPDTCTMVMAGGYDTGDGRNVPMPEIPEHTVFDERTQRVKVRGWRFLLRELVKDRYVRPEGEPAEWLGEGELSVVRPKGCF